MADTKIADLDLPVIKVDPTDGSDSQRSTVYGGSKATANRRLGILQWISPSVPWERHGDVSKGRVDGVGQWLLQTDECLKWRYGEDEVTNQVLFCYGDAGVGKTYLNSLLVDTLCNAIGDRNEIVSGVYCDFYAYGGQAITRLLGLLLKQILSKMERIPTEIQESFGRAKGRLDGGMSRLPEILHLLISTLSSVPRAYICIDALDEFPAEHRPELFSALVRVVDDLPGARLFITGRSDIRDEVERCFAGSVVAKLIEPPNEEIERYLKMRLAQDKNPRAMDEDLETDIIRIVPRATSEKFFLVCFKIDEVLARGTIAGRRESLEKVANYRCAGDVYSAALDRVEGLCEQSKAIAREVLLWVSHSERPLKAEELVCVVQSELGTKGFNIPEALLTKLVLACSQGLVTLDEKASTLRLRHFTLRNHLCNYLAMFDRAHSKIAEFCLTYLYWTSKYNKGEPGETLLGQYASSYWVTHARRQPTTSVKSLALKLLIFYRESPGCCVDILREKGVWPELCVAPSNGTKFTALHYVAVLGIDDFAGGWLWSQCWGEELNGTDSYGSTPLVWASRCANEGVVNSLLQMESIKPDQADTLFRRTPLSWAAERGHERIVQLLLAQDSVDPNTECNRGRTPLFWAIRCRKERIVMLLLENAEVDPNREDGIRKMTPLHWALNSGHRGITKLLLRNKKVDPNIPKDYTPLHWAAKNRDRATVKLLLERGDIKPDSFNKYCQTPLALAARHGNGDIVKLLLERDDVDRNALDDIRATPLITAVARNRRDIVEQLLGAGGVDLGRRDTNGRTSLHWGASIGNESIVKLLLKQPNVDPNSADIFGQTPLSRAAQGGHHGVVKILLGVAGIDPCLPDDGGRTPLAWAQLRMYKDVMRLLQGP